MASEKEKKLLDRIKTKKEKIAELNSEIVQSISLPCKTFFKLITERDNYLADVELCNRQIQNIRRKQHPLGLEIVSKQLTILR